MRSGAQASLESAAAALHLSPRTLHRRLQEQELSFRQVFAAVCAELEQNLELQGFNRSQIAERLGYADINAYRRARKRWQELGED
ncbi:Bacterial regulatory protein, Fis family [compost metagenome]